MGYNLFARPNQYRFPQGILIIITYLRNILENKVTLENAE